MFANDVRITPVSNRPFSRKETHPLLNLGVHLNPGIRYIWAPMFSLVVHTQFAMLQSIDF